MKKKLMSVKELLQLPKAKQALATQFGNDYDLEAVVIASRASFWAREPLPLVVESDSDKVLSREHISEKMFRRLVESVRKGDGTFLRRLADAVERVEHPIDSVRLDIALAAAHQKTEKNNRVLLTANAWVDALGHKVDVVLFRRWAKELGLELLPDKRGPKPARKLKLKKAN